MNHLKQIAAKLDEYKLDAMLITSDPGEYYAIGVPGEGMVIVTRSESRYFTDSRYIEAAGNLVTGAHITMTDRNKNFMVLAEQAVQELGIQKMGFEDGYVTVASYNQYSKLPCELVPAQSLVNNLRAAKDEEEIALMKRAQEKGILEFRAHDLRDWTHDRHRTPPVRDAAPGRGEDEL